MWDRLYRFSNCSVSLRYNDGIVGDGFPVPKPNSYEFAETDAKIKHFTAGTGNPSPTMAYDEPSGKLQSEFLPYTGYILVFLPKNVNKMKKLPAG